MTCILLAQGRGGQQPLWLMLGAFCWLMAGYALVLVFLPRVRAQQRRPTTAWGSLWRAAIAGGFGYWFLAEPFGWPMPLNPAAGLLVLIACISTIGLALYAKLGAQKLMSWSTGEHLPQQLAADATASSDPTVESLLESGEQLLWQGVPDPRLFRDEAIAQFVFSFIPLTAGCVALGLTIFSLVAERWSVGIVVALFAAVIFFSVGGYCFMAPWRVPRELARTVYAITSRRVLVIRSPGLREQVYTFDAQQVARRLRKRRSKRRTDLVFGLEEYRGRKRRRYYADIGFLGVEDWQGVDGRLEAFVGSAAVASQGSLNL